MGADSQTAVVLNRGGLPMPHLVDLAAREHNLKLHFVDLQHPLEQLVDACGDTPMLIVSGQPENLLALAYRLPTLRLIQTFTAGTDWLDVASLAGRGIQVADNNGANAVVVAERAIGLIYAIQQQIEQQFNSAKAGTWQQGVDFDRPVYTFENRRIGIVGLGRIGSRVAKRLINWECDVVFHDTAELQEDHVEATGARRLPYDELLQTSDVVSLHVPLNRLTHGFFSDREFSLMKNSAIFINTCRGAVLNEAALIRALQQDRLFGAGIDVTQVEPIELDNPLLSMPNVAITPHSAGRSVQVGAKINAHTIANAARAIRGENPVSIATPV
jgi:D-3-phosphoglycerate dehydrogenase